MPTRSPEPTRARLAWTLNPGLERKLKLEAEDLTSTSLPRAGSCFLKPGNPHPGALSKKHQPFDPKSLQKPRSLQTLNPKPSPSLEIPNSPRAESPQPWYPERPTFPPQIFRFGIGLRA